MSEGRPALGSATHSCSIVGLLRTPWGGPRFYLPGEHPATWRMRQHRDEILKYFNKHPGMALWSPEAYRNGCEALAYIERQLADFEAGEDQAKEIAWDQLREEWR